MSVSMSAGANYDPRANESSNHASEDSDESISDSEAEPVLQLVSILRLDDILKPI